MLQHAPVFPAGNPTTARKFLGFRRNSETIRFLPLFSMNTTSTAVSTFFLKIDLVQFCAFICSTHDVASGLTSLADRMSVSGTRYSIPDNSDAKNRLPGKYGRI